MHYLITFSCYGCHLHGDETGSVDRDHNLPRSRLVEPDLKRRKGEREHMEASPYQMDQLRRDNVLSAIQSVCAHRLWTLYAAHVRTNHVHVVVEAEETPERVMNDFKAYSTRRLNGLGVDGRNRKHWARHGSTRWLNNPEDLAAAIRYVVDEQGAAMSVFEEDRF